MSLESNQKKKPKAKEKSEKPEYKCEFCKKVLAKESSLISHVCEKKRRWLNKDDRYARMGFMAYKKFYDMTYRNAKPRQYSDFMESSHYTSFVRFGRYLIEIQALNPEAFVEFLLKAEVPMKNWELPFVYEQFVRELNKKEPAESAFERNVLLMQQWEMDTDEPWYDFFKKVNTNEATALIRAGRLSPWVLYIADTAPELLNRMTEEQLKMIEQYVNPTFWERKFAQHPEDVKFIRDLLTEAGV